MVFDSQPAGDVSHKPGSRLPSLSARLAVTFPARGPVPVSLLVEQMGVNSLPKTVTRQCRGCDLNPGPSVPESSTLTTRLPSYMSQSYLLVGSSDAAFCCCDCSSLFSHLSKRFVFVSACCR